MIRYFGSDLQKTTKRTLTILALIIAVSFLPPASQSFAQQGDPLATATALSSAFETVAEQITPSVVNIVSVKKVQNIRVGGRKAPQFNDPFFEHFREFFGDDFLDHMEPPRQGPDGFGQQGLGTGVVVSKDGYIITNNHVIQDADEVTVTLNKDKKYKAKVIGTDSKTDLAIIQIKAPDLIPATLGNSDNLRIGEWILACGNPFGLDNTVTSGIVSAKGRSFMGGGQYEDFIQTDAAINPGNSGGPLVNLKGEVVGINTAIFSRSGGYMGIGFAIPINMAKEVMNSLIKKGKVVRGWLGVGIQELTPELAQSFNYSDTKGALVGHVDKSGPADKAGVREGDIIVSINGQNVADINQLRNIVAQVEPDSSAKLAIVREGKSISVTVKVGEQPAKLGFGKDDLDQDQNDGIDSSAIDELGLEVEELNAELARRLRISDSHGIIVRNVSPVGIAASAGIRPRDIIVSVNGVEVDSVEKFKKAIEKNGLSKGIRLMIRTDGMQRFVFLRKGEE